MSDSDRVLLYILSQNNKIRALDVMFSETPYETQKTELMNRYFSWTLTIENSNTYWTLNHLPQTVLYILKPH